jgi:hypothetical protein
MRCEQRMLQRGSIVRASLRRATRWMLSSTHDPICAINDSMLSRIILSMAMATALFTAPMGLTAQSCILSSAPEQQACRPGSCANKACCATSSEHKSTPSHPLTKADSSYKVNATFIALSVVAPSPESGAQRFAVYNAESSAHSPPTLALICIRLI